MSEQETLAQPIGAVRVTPRPGGFGAEVRGIDLSRPLESGPLEEVLRAFADHSVVWFPEQPMTHDTLEAFGAALGEFGAEPYVEPVLGRPHVVEVRRNPEETEAPFGGGWHSDWSFLETPPSASLLHAKVVPPVGGDTLFADGAAAYDALSLTLQRFLGDLRAIHTAAGPYGPNGYFARETGRRGMKIIVSPEAERTFSHPLVRTHPVTGRKALFISPGYVCGVEGLAPAEAAALLGFLFAHMVEERFVYRHAWSPDMLTMWDNRCVTHCAQGGYDGHLRVMHRLTLAGEAPQ